MNAAALFAMVSGLWSLIGSSAVYRMYGLWRGIIKVGWLIRWSRLHTAASRNAAQTAGTCVAIVLVFLDEIVILYAKAELCIL